MYPKGLNNTSSLEKMQQLHWRSCFHTANLCNDCRFHRFPRTITYISSPYLSKSFFITKKSPQNREFVTGLFNYVRIQQLERKAAQSPRDSSAQLALYSGLLRLNRPERLAERFENSTASPGFTNSAIVTEQMALLYLEALQRMGVQTQFNARRFARQLRQIRGINPNVLEGINRLGSGSSRMALAMEILRAGSAQSGPIHVHTVGSNAGGFRNYVVGGLRTWGIYFIIFSLAGAFMDESFFGPSLRGAKKSPIVQEAQEDSTVRFDDVKGVDEAKAELEEIVLYLKDPSNFTRLGGKLSRGLLLTGPPGTGKTMLAKAVAGEAGVPFFFSSGSQFDEVYVGVGAKRVRELFQQAKKKAPCIIFIDEIDAVGGKRKSKDESTLKATLNELLVQMDGFDQNSGIVVIGATNFVESLDSAILRPGRFDKQVAVLLPDVGGRKEILQAYAGKTKLSKDVDLDILARGTVGFSGADLYNLMNQAALKASVDGLDSITMEVLEYAKDKIVMGAERKTAIITPKTARCTAFHEAGHALVAALTEGAQPIHKATILPRGQTLGMVTMLPEGDQTSQNYTEMLATMDVCMGGRVAEELVFGKENVTSGASSDIMNATRIARAMVTKLGFSEEVGIVYHGGGVGEESASANTRARIDEEVKKLTDESYLRAKDLLIKHKRQHHLLAETLLEYESLTGDEVRDIIFRNNKPKRNILNTAKGARGDQNLVSGTRK